MSQSPLEIVQNLTPVMRLRRVLDQQDQWRAELDGRVGRRVGPRGADLRLRESDVPLLLTLIRYRCVVIDDLSTTVDLHVDSVRRRLRRMIDAGLVTTAPYGPMARTVYMATTAAMKLVGVTSREASGSWGQMSHRLLLAHWGLRLEVRRWSVVTEFEVGVQPSRLLHVRRDLPVNPNVYATTAAWTRAMLAQRTHRPDLVIHGPGAGDGDVIAVEVELTLKSKQTLHNIMAAYERSSHIVNKVSYACADSTIEQAVAQAARSVNFDRLRFGELPEPPWATR